MSKGEDHGIQTIQGLEGHFEGFGFYDGRGGSHWRNLTNERQTCFTFEKDHCGPYERIERIGSSNSTHNNCYLSGIYCVPGTVQTPQVHVLFNDFISKTLTPSYVGGSRDSAGRAGSQLRLV